MHLPDVLKPSIFNAEMPTLWERARCGLELQLPAGKFGCDLGWHRQSYPAHMVSAGIADRIMLIKWNAGATFKMVKGSGISAPACESVQVAKE